MTVRFALTVWVCYVAQMNGSPPLEVKSAQKVLEYFMGNVKELVKAWRRRQYFYASASVFNSVGIELKTWVNPTKKDKDGEDVIIDGCPVIIDGLHKKRIKSLFKVSDDGVMFKLVGDALVAFIAQKPAPFPGACVSQETFLFVPAWKRALLYINLVRHVTEKHANRHWFKYGYKQYKQNKKMMETYCELDEEIVKRSVEFNKLPEKVDPTTPVKAPKKKRT